MWKPETSCEWTTPVCPLSYDPGTLDVWLVEIPEASIHHSAFNRILSQDEKTKAACYHFSKDALRYLTTRLALRKILAKFYLNVDPSNLMFGYSDRGKPYLLSSAAPRLHFNVSHSADRALIAASWDDEVGVDIELAKPLDDALDIARRFFSESESKLLDSLEGPEQILIFYRIWTRKEAVLKACGEGLMKPLNSFTVINDGKSLEVLLDEQAWQLADLPLDQNYLGAVCVGSPKTEIRTFNYGVLDMQTALENIRPNP